MSEIWFVRHGQSESNANMVTQSPESTPLTPKGHQEAGQVADYLVGMEKRPSQIALSDYHRAQQTAVYTINHFPDLPTVTWPIHEWTYLAPERYHGTRAEDRAPYARAYWERMDPHEKENGKGESFTGLLERIEETKQLCLQQTAPLTVGFSHSLFVRGLLWDLLMGQTAPTFDMMRRYHNFVHSVPMPNCSILRLTVNPQGTFSLIPIDASHLKVVIAQSEATVD